MTSNSETGHASNVANFNALVLKVKSYGTVYNPSRQALSVSSLTSLALKAEEVMSLVNSALGQASIAIAHRATLFAPLNKLTTRVLNALRASETPHQIDLSAQTLVRKIQGRRATPRKTAEQKAALAVQGTTVKEVSSSQLSFDNRVDSFDKLVQLLLEIPEYAPNEEDLKTSSLIAYLNTLKSANAEAANAETVTEKARMMRNEVLYKEDSGLVDLALATKLYIKSLFGASSPQYKQLSSLKFKIRKADKVSADVSIAQPDVTTT